MHSILVVIDKNDRPIVVCHGLHVGDLLFKLERIVGCYGLKWKFFNHWKIVAIVYCFGVS